MEGILGEYLVFYIKSTTLQSVDSFVLTYGYNVHNYSPIPSSSDTNILRYTRSLKLVYKHFSNGLTHNQNKYYRIRQRNIGKRYRNVKITSHYHIQHLLL